jgi:thiazole tautomerase (transcriptional regulator TenI)
MRPLPRVLAFADARIAALDDLGVRAAAIAAAGPSVALVARWPGGSADQLATLAQRFVANATPPMASVLVTGRAEVALAVGAQGVILRKNDLKVETVRKLCHPERSEGSARHQAIPHMVGGDKFIFRSVHSFAEAEQAVEQGADAVIVGSIWPSASHPDGTAAGTALLEEVVTLGVPVYAIGGVTSARAAEARAAGAWGVATISAVWDAANQYQAAMEILQTWN